MSDTIHKLTALRRPHLLIETARAGLARYRTGAAAQTILSHPGLRADDALAKLFDLEDSLNQKRRQKSPKYDVKHHIGLLTAIMGEAAALAPASQSQIT